MKITAVYSKAVKCHMFIKAKPNHTLTSLCFFASALTVMEKIALAPMSCCCPVPPSTVLSEKGKKKWQKNKFFDTRYLAKLET